VTDRRYPLQPLLDAAGMTMSDLRQHCPMDGSTYRNARARGLIEQQADSYACRLGLLPWLVWSDWLDELHVTCADEKCTQRFVPRTQSHRYCSKACGNRVRTRLLLARKRQDPAFREAERLRRQANYAQTREYEAKRQRLLYATDPRFRAQKNAARARRRAAQREAA
jgi:hypothetical protein